MGNETTDIEMIDDWIEETSQPYETIFSERHDGIYIVLSRKLKLKIKRMLMLKH